MKIVDVCTYSMCAHTHYMSAHTHILHIHTYLSCAQAGKTAYEVATAEVKTAMDALKKEQVSVCACMCACVSACCIRVVMFM